MTFLLALFGLLFHLMRSSSFEFKSWDSLHFAISSLGLGVIIAKWSSNSKYAFLGSLRSTAQMVSYDLARPHFNYCPFMCWIIKFIFDCFSTKVSGLVYLYFLYLFYFLFLV